MFRVQEYPDMQYRPGNGAEMNCDHCKFYCWYFDRCGKWDCKVDPREVHNCFESNEIHVIRDIMVSGSQQEQKTKGGDVMGLDKAIAHGKEHRKPYRGSKAIDATCRNHGSCPWCEENRKHKFRDKHPPEKD